MSKTANTFARIADDWVELFSVGPKTDSNGNSKVWTDDELAEMAANFDPNDAFPIVIGHPKMDSPAWGWGQALKHEAGKLFARFEKLAPKFIEWGQAGHIRNRSVKIVKGPKGYRIAHVGFLGAAPPAVEGMEAIQFSAADDGQVFEFAWRDAQGLNLFARMQRRLREFLIEKYGQETADRVTPVHDAEDAERLAAEVMAEPTAPAAASSFTAPETSPMSGNDKTFTQADIEAAEKRARDDIEAKYQAQLKAAEFSQRVSTNQAFVDNLVKDKDGKCRLTPARAAGVAEFLATLEGVDAAEFTFSAEGTEKKAQLAQFAKDMLAGLPVQLNLGKEQADKDAGVDRTSANAIGDAAQQYISDQAAKGVTINIAQAVSHVMSAQRR